MWRLAVVGVRDERWCTAVVEVKIVRSRLISEFFGGDMDGTCG